MQPNWVPWSKEEEQEIGRRLRKQLGPEYISIRQGPGGSRVHYIEGNKAIESANNVFGFGGWANQICAFSVDSEEVSNGKITISVSVIIRITLRNGCFHEDVGFGTAINMRSKAEAMEKAKKEAVTDGLKRCMRMFGDALGNCLYDKEYLKMVSRCKSTQLKVFSEENMIRPTTHFETLGGDDKLAKDAVNANGKRMGSPEIDLTVEDVLGKGEDDYDHLFEGHEWDIAANENARPNKVQEVISKPPERSNTPPLRPQAQQLKPMPLPQGQLVRPIQPYPQRPSPIPPFVRPPQLNPILNQTKPEASPVNPVANPTFRPPQPSNAASTFPRPHIGNSAQISRGGSSGPYSNPPRPNMPPQKSYARPIYPQNDPPVRQQRPPQ